MDEARRPTRSAALLTGSRHGPRGVRLGAVGEAKEDFNAGLNHLDVSWTILRTYDALNGCREDQAKLLAGNTGWMPYPGRTRLDDGFSASAYDESGKLRWTVKQRALCVPGTLDPRGPKGGK